MVCGSLLPDPWWYILWPVVFPPFSMIIPYMVCGRFLQSLCWYTLWFVIVYSVVHGGKLWSMVVHSVALGGFVGIWHLCG